MPTAASMACSFSAYCSYILGSYAECTSSSTPTAHRWPELSMLAAPDPAQRDRYSVDREGHYLTDIDTAYTEIWNLITGERRVERVNTVTCELIIAVWSTYSAGQAQAHRYDCGGGREVYRGYTTLCRPWYLYRWQPRIIRPSQIRSSMKGVLVSIIDAMIPWGYFVSPTKQGQFCIPSILTRLARDMMALMCRCCPRRP
jgi:hypothetical protein